MYFLWYTQNCYAVYTSNLVIDNGEKFQQKITINLLNISYFVPMINENLTKIAFNITLANIYI